MKGLIIFLGAAIVACGLLYWWSTRVERCLAREPRGYWYFSGPEIDPRSSCKRQSSPTFLL